MKIIRTITNQLLSRRGFLQGVTATSITSVVLTESGWNPLRANHETSDALSLGFVQPPPSAKVFVQFWWLSDIRRVDITRDLEAMKRQGIQGGLIFSENSSLEPDKDALLQQLLWHAMKEADRLGMEVAVKDMSGQTLMAGSWIEREHALKKPVWAEEEVAGPQEHVRIAVKPKDHDGFYRDVAVLAFKARATGKPPLNHIKMADAKITSSPAVKNPVFAIDEDPTTAARVGCIRLSCFPSTVLEPWMKSVNCAPDPKWIGCEFSEPYTTSSVFVYLDKHVDMPTECELQQSDDGDRYSTICRWHARMDEPITVPFKETRSRFYRLVITENNSSELNTSLDIRQFDLLKAGEHPAWPIRINHWRVRTGQLICVPWYDPEVLERQATQVTPEEADLAIGDVVDLTGKVQPDGQLEWDVPPGRWRVLRFGYTLVPADLKRYFCDVLSKEATEAAFEGLPRKVIAIAGPLAGRTLKFFYEDSWEPHVKAEKPWWTPSLPEEFKRRRKYDMRSYLPALAGKVVESGDITDRFLWDSRRTVADMVVDNYVAIFSELCRRHGVGFHEEIPGGYVSGLFDGLHLHARADAVSGELWARSEEVEGKVAVWEATSRRFGDSVTTAASAAHTNGKKIVGAETFTN